MEPATLEMSEFSNVSVVFAFTLVIGAIGFMSYSLAKTFKDFTRIRAESHEILELPETLDLSDNVLTTDADNEADDEAEDENENENEENENEENENEDENEEDENEDENEE